MAFRHHWFRSHCRRPPRFHCRRPCRLHCRRPCRPSTADDRADSTADVRADSTADGHAASTADNRVDSTADVRTDATADDRADSTADDHAASTADGRADSTADDHAAPRPRLKEQGRLIEIENGRLRALVMLEHCITLSSEELTEMPKRASTHHRCQFTGTWRREVIATRVVPAMQPCFPCTVLRLARPVAEEADCLAGMDEDEKAGEPLGFKRTMHRNIHLRRTREVVRKPYDRAN